MTLWRKILRSKYWTFLPVGLLLIGAVVAFTIVRRANATPVAATAVVGCTGDDAASFDCWQNRYMAMTSKQSPEAAFKDLKANDATNPYVKANCHQLGHVIGRTAALKYKTLEETYKHGDQYCWSGYYHGAIETVAKRIGPDKIVAQLNTVCQSFFTSKPYGFDHYNCVHGMGHGLMAVEKGELFTALKICDDYTDSWEQQSCYSGVFMENVMNEINPGSHSNYLKADDPLYPCTAVDNRYKEQCYLMQTSHALLTVNYDYNKVFTLCSQVEQPYADTCYQSLGRDVSGQSSSNQERTIALCMQGPDAVAVQNCFTGAVKDFISYYHDDDQGLAMCAAIPDATQSADCTSVAKQYYTEL